MYCWTGATAPISTSAGQRFPPPERSVRRHGQRTEPKQEAPVQPPGDVISPFRLTLNDQGESGRPTITAVIARFNKVCEGFNLMGDGPCGGR